MVIDSRLTGIKRQLLAEKLQILSKTAQLELLGPTTTEDEVIALFKTNPYHLILVPWHVYVTWGKMDTFLGSTRTSGAVFAGYMAENVLYPDVEGKKPSSVRATLVDFSTLSSFEILSMIRTLCEGASRTGIRPFLEANTPIYTETWLGNQGMGLRADSVGQLSEIQEHDWQERLNAVRICLTALWSLVYEEGPGKTQVGQPTHSKAPKAYFQVAVDSHFIVMRLCLSMYNWKPGDVVNTFWPRIAEPSSNIHLLTAYSDFVRIMSVANTNDVEIVVGFAKSAPSRKAYRSVRTLITDIVSQDSVIENPSQTSQNPNYRTLPNIVVQMSKQKERSADFQRVRDRALTDSNELVRSLRKEIFEKDQYLKELRMGGVGQISQAPLPEVEALLDAFKERLEQSQFEIDQISEKIKDLQAAHAPEQECLLVKTRMDVLKHNQLKWITQLSEILRFYRNQVPLATRSAGSPRSKKAQRS